MGNGAGACGRHPLSAERLFRTCFAMSALPSFRASRQAGSVHTRSPANRRMSDHREASMKTTLFAALLLAPLAAGTSFAQPAPFNEEGVTNGHWHLNSRDVAVNEKIFV